MAQTKQNDFASSTQLQNTSFEKEWVKHYPMLLRVARKIARRASLDPEDLLSQATVKVLSYYEKNNEIRSFPSLMCLSIKQVYLDCMRNHRDLIFLKSSEFDGDFNSPLLQSSLPFAEQRHSTNETLIQILKYVHTLPPSSKELFYLRFFDDCSFAEIAKITGLTEANARKIISKLRAKLHILTKDEK